MLPGALLTAAVGPYARLDVAAMLARLERYPWLHRAADLGRDAAFVSDRAGKP